MKRSDISSVIQNLETEVERMQQAIDILKSIDGGRTAKVTLKAPVRRRLSPQARKRISQAAKRRWAAVRAAKK
jgi:hypothetical protein